MFRVILKGIWSFVVLGSWFWCTGISGYCCQQASSDYEVPREKESYFATLGPMAEKGSVYFGLSGGAGKWPIESEPSTEGDPDSVSTWDLFGYQVGLVGGCGRNFRHLYLGTEAVVEYNSINREIYRKEDIDKSVEFIKIEQPLIVAGDFVFGYVFRPRNFMFYGKVGLGSSILNFKYTYTEFKSELEPGSDSESSSVTSSYRISKFSWGPRFGGGIRYMLTNNSSLAMEYLRVTRGEAQGVLEGVTYTVEQSRNHQFRLVLLFSF